ncbi:oligosaccharide amylase [Methanococcus maripaludis]|uniref:Oligosaccharide amylase n=1 Tax=Methanococcus maripaludis TaxID=39152 RepID=A0A7J9NZK7_METMI|nr:glycoside hydrolase family 15 protein [Methanococcus maripaludis]MBA2852503.1 oligosaccharide amylase [Methanococcus maripaludis]
MVGIIGNGNILAKIDDSGSIEYMFYPSLGYEKHIFDASFAIYNHGLRWAWDNGWEINQSYVKDTNILRTTYECNEFLMESRDYIPISHNIIIKQISISNKTDETQDLKLFFYENLRMGEIPRENTVQFMKDPRMIMKYDGMYTMCIGSDKKIDSYQCGVRSSDKSALIDISNGILKEYSTSSGLITDSAISWDLKLLPGQKQSVSVYIIMNEYKGDQYKLMETMDSIKVVIDNHEDFYQLTNSYWKNLLETTISKLSANELNRVSMCEDLCKRSLLTLLLLCDRGGGIMASPSLYPDYRHVWCRDGGYIAVALSLCGQSSIVEKYFEWCRKTQNEDGSWVQSYYINGIPRLTAMQIDQVGTTIWAALIHYRKSDNEKFLRKNWAMLKKAADYLSNVSTGLYPSYDLWEEKYGVFTYTLGSMYGGLKSAVEIAKILEENEGLIEKWQNSLKFLKEEVVEKIYLNDKNRFSKALHPKDETVDSSILGITVPFNLVNADDPRMVATADQIDSAFNYKVGGIGRYPKDVYFGGNPWIINTLWLYMYYELLIYDLSKNKSIKKEILNNYREKSSTLFDWVCKYNFSGLMPEQIHKDLGVPISAMPLGWSHAMFIIAVHGDFEILIP